jgi:predicted nucleic acid-binding protein
VVLIDTSSWVDALRTRGRADVRQRVDALIQSGEACWCEAIRLELWNGRGGEQEQRKLRDFDEVMPVLPINDAVWELSLKLAQNARTQGLTMPAIDLLIAACAFHHGAKIESADEHFQHLEKWR